MNDAILIELPIPESTDAVNDFGTFCETLMGKLSDLFEDDEAAEFDGYEQDGTTFRLHIYAVSGEASLQKMRDLITQTVWPGSSALTVISNITDPDKSSVKHYDLNR